MGSFKVLIVDDENDFRESLVRRLQRRAVDATGVASGEAALDHIAAHAVDVVVLDIKMPGLNGVETLREIKRRHPSVQVILLTGHASVESGVEGLTLEAFDYLIKPVKLDDLIERIMEAYEHRKLLADLSSKERRGTSK